MFPASYYPFLRNNGTQHFKGNIKVYGTGTVKVKPNEVNIQLGVLTRDKSAKNAQQENAVNSTRLISALKILGIEPENIQTISYTVLPNYKIIDNQQVLDSFEVSHQLMITLKNINNVGEVYDTAFLSGANTTQNLLFTVSDPSKYFQEALSLAVKDAINKAQTIAQSVGTTIHLVPIKITELDGVRPLQFRQEAFMATPSTPIMVSDVEIIAKVESTFSYN